MLDLTWNVFTKTGNIDTYLLMKEMEQQDQDLVDETDDEEILTNEPTQ